MSAKPRRINATSTPGVVTSSALIRVPAATVTKGTDSTAPVIFTVHAIEVHIVYALYPYVRVVDLQWRDLNQNHK